MPVKDDNYTDAINVCLARLHTTRVEVLDKIADGDWLVWSSHVSREEGLLDWAWKFLPDIETTLPDWLDVDSRSVTDPMLSLMQARVPIDSSMCHKNSGDALAERKSGYAHVFRVWLRDHTAVWIEERVAIEWEHHNSSVIVGIARKADEKAIETGKSALAAFEEWACAQPENQIPSDAEQLQRRLDGLKRDIELLGRSGRWVIWAAEVRQMCADPFRLHWDFRGDFIQILPDWLDIDRVAHEDLALTLGRARLHEDSGLCNETVNAALLTGKQGYNHVFRVRQRDGSISYVDESATVQPIGPDKWHIVGVCIDATERKEAEDRLVAQNIALQDMQAELESQQSELQAQQGELQTQNEELLRLHEVLEADKRALAEANERLASLATTDGLTGIKNHRALREQLEAELQAAARYHTPLSFVMIDIDKFKHLNDDFGHLVGDSVLIEVAHILKESIRECDFIARYGGEEFAVILPRTDRAGAEALADRFRTSIEAASWRHRKITASFGVATTSIECATADALIGNADTALYQAKSAGRNCVVSHAPA